MFCGSSGTSATIREPTRRFSMNALPRRQMLAMTSSRKRAGVISAFGRLQSSGYIGWSVASSRDPSGARRYNFSGNVATVSESNRTHAHTADSCSALSTFTGWPLLLLVPTSRQNSPVVRSIGTPSQFRSAAFTRPGFLVFGVSVIRRLP